MTDLAATDDLFFTNTALSLDKAQSMVDEALHGSDDGELFLEYRQAESIMFDDGRVKSASFDTAQGFGLRAVSGEATGYAHASEMSEDALARASKTVRAVIRGNGGAEAVPLKPTNRSFYGDHNPLSLVPFEDKVGLLAEMDTYARSLDSDVKQVTASVLGSWQAVQIVRAGGERVADIRPLVRLNVQVVLEKDGRMEMGSHGMKRICSRKPGNLRSTKRCAKPASTFRPTPPLLVKWSSFLVLAGLVFCCTKPLVMVSKVILIVRKHLRLQVCVVRPWPRPV